MLTREKLIDSVLQREFKKAHRIIVDGKHCYRPELFRDKGWCKIIDESPPISPIPIPIPPRPHRPRPARPSTKWGFCSSSCKVKFMKVCMLNIH